jgi:hypothetical protein
MKVKELIELLKTFDQELRVYTSAEYEMELDLENISVEETLGTYDGRKDEMVGKQVALIIGA